MKAECDTRGVRGRLRYARSSAPEPSNELVRFVRRVPVEFLVRVWRAVSRRLLRLCPVRGRQHARRRGRDGVNVPHDNDASSGIALPCLMVLEIRPCPPTRPSYLMRLRDPIGAERGVLQGVVHCKGPHLCRRKAEPAYATVRTPLLHTELSSLSSPSLACRHTARALSPPRIPP